MKWIKDESTVKPEAVDIGSSQTTVYLHRNIVETERDGKTVYTYETAKLTPAEFQVYVAAEQYKALLG